MKYSIGCQFIEEHEKLYERYCIQENQQLFVHEALQGRHSTCQQHLPHYSAHRLFLSPLAILLGAAKEGVLSRQKIHV